MTTEQVAPKEVEAVPAKTIEKQPEAVAEPETTEAVSTGQKRSFEDIQPRAITIHDIEDEDDEADGEYLEEVEEEEEEATPENENDEEVEESDSETEEADEDVSVEELSAIVEESGLNVSEGLNTKVLRGGKKIVAPMDSEEVEKKALELLVASAKPEEAKQTL